MEEAVVKPPVIVDKPAPVVTPKDLDAEIRELNGQLQDAFFDYDRADPRADGVAALRHDAELLHAILPDFPGLKVVVEGHCDERGSAEYNLGLGARRANRAVEILHGFEMTLPALDTITYGKEAPQCTESSESCWRMNRRAHLIVSATDERR
jgi:peptidoglycan-associated lipoprotein